MGDKKEQLRKTAKSFKITMKKVFRDGRWFIVIALGCLVTVLFLSETFVAARKTIETLASYVQ